MFEENEKEWILETINHLKHRKARPDLSRISLRMKKRYFMSFAQTKSLLESLIESGIVVKAVYKNNTSYRDVSKWKKGRLGGQIMNSNRMLKRFIRAIEAIEKTKDTGVTAQDIEDYFKESHGEEKCFLSGAALRDALENEITNGYLKKHCNGLLVHYSVNKDNSDNVLSEDDINDVKTELDLDLDQTTQSSDHSFESKFDCNSSSDILYLLSNVIKAINETQKSEEVGSTLGDIKDFLIIKGFNFSDDAFLYEFLENEVTRGNLSKSVQDTKYFYSVNMNCVQILDLDLDDSSKTEDIVNEPTETFDIKKSKGKANSSRSNTSVTHSETNINTGIRSTHVEKVKKVKIEKENLAGDTQTQNAPLRPPSKRKRIMKDHGPDFEIELPTKVKNKITTDIKESIYPTPTNSPASEKSETNVYHSFQFDKKKRGRPKKCSSPSTSCNASVVDQLEEDSQHASLCDDPTSSVDNGERACSTSPHPDISHWTAEQVASYFLSKGYQEEAQSMLEHDLDGTALGLLRRSDIVGPPLGGILKIKKLGVALKLFRDIRNLLYQGNVDNYLDPYEEKSFLRS